MSDGTAMEIVSPMMRERKDGNNFSQMSAQNSEIKNAKHLLIGNLNKVANIPNEIYIHWDKIKV